MLEDIKKGLLSGLGAVVLTKGKIEAIGRKMQEEARLSDEDAEKLKEELYASGQRQWDDLASSISDALSKTLSGLDIGSRSALDRLSARVDALEKKLSEMETPAGGREK